MTASALEGPIFSSKPEIVKQPRHRCFFPSRSEAQSGPGQWLEATIELEGLDLRGWCRIKEIKLAVLSKAVWTIVLARYVGTEDVCFELYDSTEGKCRRPVVSTRLEGTTTVGLCLREVEVGDASTNLLYVVGGSDDVRRDDGGTAREDLCNQCLGFLAEEQSSDPEAKGQFERNIAKCNPGKDIVLCVDATRKATLPHSPTHL